MFYQDEHDIALRFGDVVQGYIKSSYKIENAFSDICDLKYRIDVELPLFSVILTPCCSIEEGSLTLSPLVKIRSDFFKNPFFVEDLTRINRPMASKNSMSEVEWSKMSYKEHLEALNQEETYALRNLFIYDENDLFPLYISRKKETKYYMIDFKDTYKISCDKIKSPENDLVSSKRLQLSVKTRKELREKISFFYGRPTKEDECELQY